jgi:hypothetical protein
LLPTGAALELLERAFARLLPLVSPARSLALRITVCRLSVVDGQVFGGVWNAAARAAASKSGAAGKPPFVVLLLYGAQRELLTRVCYVRRREGGSDDDERQEEGRRRQPRCQVRISLAVCCFGLSLQHLPLRSADDVILRTSCLLSSSLFDLYVSIALRGCLAEIMYRRGQVRDDTVVSGLSST